MQRSKIRFGWLAIFLMVGLWANPVMVNAQVRKTAAIQVYAAASNDVEVANQVRKIAVDTFENYRNLLTKRYLTDKDVKLAEELGEILTAANGKVSTGMRGKVFDEGVVALDSAYLKSKAALGELEPELVQQLYVGLAMSKAVLGNRGLAVDYMTLFANMVGETGRQKVSYNALFQEIWAEAWKRVSGTDKFKVTIKVEPAGALVGVDGKTWGKAPLEVDLAAGSHLVQVEAEGYARSGWVKDPRLQGRNWNLKLAPYPSRQRYLDTVKRLGDYFSPPPVAPEKPKRRKRGKSTPAPLPAIADDALEGTIAALSELLDVDYLLFVTVSTEGSEIRLKGVFYSVFGLHKVDEKFKRDSKIIESVRSVLLAASDLEVLKKSLAEQQTEEQHLRLVRWADDLLEGIAGSRTTLMRRVEQWELVGQQKKAILFAATAGDVAALEAQARQARAAATSDPQGARKSLDGVATAWKGLEPKVRSLLAWDIERALAAMQSEQLVEMKDVTAKRLVELKELLTEKSEKLEKTARRAFAKDMESMKKWGKTVDKLLAKDPLSKEARGLLYRILLKEAEIRRLLKLI
jgi:hypothetical protein